MNTQQKLSSPYKDAFFMKSFFASNLKQKDLKNADTQIYFMI